MMNDSERSQQKVSLEELLRLKRAERPSPEFWSAFETDLRAKQLAAIVEKRPWWISLRLPQAYRAFARVQLPVGAAAAVALTFVVVREYRPSGNVSPVIDGGNAIVAVAGATSATSDAQAQSSGSLQSRANGPLKSERALTSLASVSKSQPHALTIVSPRSDSRRPDDPLIAEIAPTSGMLTEMIPWGAAPEVVRNVEPAHVAGEVAELKPSSFVADALPGREHDFKGSVEVAPVFAGISSSRSSAGEIVDGVVSDVVASAVVVSSVSGSNRGAVVNSASVAAASSQRELRRSRILSTLVADSSEISNVPMAVSRDVLAGDLSDDRNFNPLSRVGMGGDRLTLKF